MTLENSVRPLKALVAVLGVLILVGFGVLGWGLAVKFNDADRKDEVSENSAALRGHAPFGETVASLPVNGEIIRLDKINGLLLVHFRTPTREGIIVLDPVSGLEQGRFSFDFTQ